MAVRPPITILAGALLVSALSFLAARDAGAIAGRLDERAETAIAGVNGRGVEVSFAGLGGLPSRHAVLRGGDGLPDDTRLAVARAVAAVPGVGGVRWAETGLMATRGVASEPVPLVCEEDVDALLATRTLRFEESSAAMDRASRRLIDEVADALRPCLGSIIAIIGHTDSSGPEPANIALSRERAEAVREALVARGIPRDGLRTRGLGSASPVDGLDPADPANRRIEFSVVAKTPVLPTPIDTPGPR